ncbi:hypothetical protein B0G69_1915 [Paraburkholderia sp. RAU2J]|nr:hypothetical protein B0G69_1915 [Paraburkholderia sp. RAU2J]
MAAPACWAGVCAPGGETLKGFSEEVCAGIQGVMLSRSGQAACTINVGARVVTKRARLPCECGEGAIHASDRAQQMRQQM